MANSVGSRADGLGDGIVVTNGNATLDSLAAARDRRTPVSAAGTTIGSGSYYLTQDLMVSSGDALTISGSNVTLDLNGYTISSTSPTRSGSGILIPATAENVTILNGHITGTTTISGSTFSGGGFAYGIQFLGAKTLTVRAVQVSGVGAGIDCGGIGELSLVEGCSVRVCASVGIAARTVRACHFSQAGSFGILCTIATDCTASAVSFNNAIDAACIQQCTGDNSSSGDGLSASGGSVSNSTGSSGSASGIFAKLVLNSRGSSSSGTGIYATGTAQNSYGDSFTGQGMQCFGVATNCFGETNQGSGGIGLTAFTANGSRGVRNGAVSQSITNKYNMP